MLMCINSLIGLKDEKDNGIEDFVKRMPRYLGNGEIFDLVNAIKLKIHTFINGGSVLSLLFVELVVPRNFLQSNNKMKNKFSVVLLFVIGI